MRAVWCSTHTLADMLLVHVAFAWISAVATASNTRGSFRVFWNVPTFSCHKYNIFFNVTSAWGVVQNSEDAFRGEQIAILYDPGSFPALVKRAGKLQPRNGGVPQGGNLTEHLQSLRKDVNRFVVDRNFSGLGVLDMESWRPVFRQLFGSFTSYKEFSFRVERKKHPFWSENKIEAEAKDRFEAAAHEFMELSLELVRQMRPLGKWGYYAFPYCFNWDRWSCPRNVQTENDRIEWLFSRSEALYPSIYLGEKQVADERPGFIRGRLREALRVAKKTKGLQNKEIYAYIRYNYHDTSNFLTLDDIKNSCTIPKELQLDGVVIWGSSNDVNTKEKCELLKQYVNQILGPVVRNLTDVNNVP